MAGLLERLHAPARSLVGFAARPDPDSILGYDIVNWRYVYHDVLGKPETAVPVRPLPGHVYAKAWSDYDRIEDWDAEPCAKRLRRRLTPVVRE